MGGYRGNGAADPGAVEAAVTTTMGTIKTTGTLGAMARKETMEEEGGGAESTTAATSEVRTRGLGEEGKG